MKRSLLGHPPRFLALLGASVLLVGSTAWAGVEPTAPSARSKTKLTATERKLAATSTDATVRVMERQVITGSYIPSKVTRFGRNTDGVSPVCVITSEDIRRSGASSVGDLMRRYGPMTR